MNSQTARNTSEAVADPTAFPVLPARLDSFLTPPSPRPVGDHGLGVWLVETARLADEEFEVGRAWLDDSERNRAASFVRAELRRAYEIAHAAARHVVGAALDLPPEKIVWGHHPCPACGEPHGRPRAEGTSIEFSLSHTPGMVLVAIADVPVGVDVERHPEDPVALSRLLHPREIEEIEAAAHGTLDGGKAAVRFTRAWSRTEAFLKGIGIGLGRDPHLDYLGSDPSAGRSVGDWQVADVVVPDGYGAAVAVRA